MTHKNENSINSQSFHVCFIPRKRYFPTVESKITPRTKTIRLQQGIKPLDPLVGHTSVRKNIVNRSARLGKAVEQVNVEVTY